MPGEEAAAALQACWQMERWGDSPAGTYGAGSTNPGPAGMQPPQASTLHRSACPHGSNSGCTHKQNARPIRKLEVEQRHLMSSGAFGLGPTESTLHPSCPPSSGLCLRGCSSAVGLGSAFFPPRSSIAWCFSELA